MQKIIIVSGPVIVESNKVLLNQHGDTEFWKFCGGRAKDGETLEETAKRRAREELGIDVETINPEPFFSHTKKETPDDTSDVILVHYLAKRIGDIKPAEFVREWKWMDLTDLEKENLAPNILPALKHFGFME